MCALRVAKWGNTQSGYSTLVTQHLSHLKHITQYYDNNKCAACNMLHHVIRKKSVHSNLFNDGHSANEICSSSL